LGPMYELSAASFGRLGLPSPDEGTVFARRVPQVWRSFPSEQCISIQTALTSGCLSGISVSIRGLDAGASSIDCTKAFMRCAAVMPSGSDETYSAGGILPLPSVSMGADGHGKRGLSFPDATPAQATVAFVRACEDAGVRTSAFTIFLTTTRACFDRRAWIFTRCKSCSATPTRG